MGRGSPLTPPAEVRSLELLQGQLLALADRKAS